MHKTRGVAIGGVLQQCMGELEEEPKDLIGKNEETDEVDQGSLSFRWQRQSKK